MLFRLAKETALGILGLWRAYGDWLRYGPLGLHIFLLISIVVILVVLAFFLPENVFLILSALYLAGYAIPFRMTVLGTGLDRKRK